jgi:antitoxin component YwqK of YwqJK toxin-antitoxin module
MVDNNRTQDIELEIPFYSKGESGTETVTVPFSAINKSDLYSSLISGLGTKSKLPFPPEYRSVANVYVSFLNTKFLSPDKLKLSLELAHLIGDMDFMQYLVKILLDNWISYKHIVDTLHEDLKTEVYSLLPHELIPFKYASKRNFVEQGLKRSSSLSVVNRNEEQHTYDVKYNDDSDSDYSYEAKYYKDRLIRFIERKNGVTSLMKTWYPNTGTIESETHFLTDDNNDKDYVKNGLYRHWYETIDGAPLQPEREVQYVNNSKDGIELTWYADGKKRSETNYDNGVVTGIVRTWYDNKHNTLESEIGYDDGLQDLNGIYRKWGTSENPLIDGYYVHGLRDTMWQEWNNDGRLTYYVQYSHGEVVMVFQQEGYGNYF